MHYKLDCDWLNRLYRASIHLVAIVYIYLNIVILYVFLAVTSTKYIYYIYI